MSRRLLACLAAAVLMLPAAAAGDARPALVEIANFDCPYCYALNQHHRRIEQAAARAGYRFIYAPVPNHARFASAWRERTYYAARNLPGLESNVRSALLETQQAPKPVRTLDEVITWLSMMVPEVRWREFANNHVTSPETIGAIERSIRLAQRAGASSFPSFLIVSSRGVELIPLPTETDALVNALIAFLESYDK